MVLQYYWHGDLWHSWLFPEQFLLQKCSFRWFTWLLQIKRSVLFMGHTSQQKQNLTRKALVVKYWLWKACKTEIFWFWLYKDNHCNWLPILFSLELLRNLMNELLPMTNAHVEKRKSFPLGHLCRWEGTERSADCDPLFEFDPRSSV